MFSLKKFTSIAWTIIVIGAVVTLSAIKKFILTNFSFIKRKQEQEYLESVSDNAESDWLEKGKVIDNERENN